MNDILANLLAGGQKKTDEAGAPVVTEPLTPAPASDLAYPLQRAHANEATGLQRLHTFTNAIAAAPSAGKKQELLLQVIDLLAEALRLEESNVGVDWREAKPEEYDTALLGQGVQLVASRMNEYAPQVLLSLMATKPAYLNVLNDETDTRHVGYVVAAAMQVIATHQLKRDHTPATRKKRADAKQARNLLGSGAAADGGNIFDELFGALDGPAPSGDLPDPGGILAALGGETEKNEGTQDGIGKQTTVAQSASSGSDSLGARSGSLGGRSLGSAQPAAAAAGAVDVGAGGSALGQQTTAGSRPIPLAIDDDDDDDDEYDALDALLSGEDDGF